MTVRNRHFEEIDGLRGVAILMVVAYHYGLEYSGTGVLRTSGLVALSHAGWMGVDLFFVLSGFLITSILQETRTSPHYFRNFLARRFLRIWPLYYVNLALLVLVAPRILHPVPDEIHVLVDKQWWFWTYMANWLFAKEGGFNQTPGGYFWSLAVEEQFYVFWPFVVWLVQGPRLMKLCAGLFAGSLILRLALGASGVPGQVLYTMTFTHLEAVAAGAFLAAASRDAGIKQWLTARSSVVMIGAIVVLVLVRSVDASFRFREVGMSRIGYTAVALLAAALLIKAHWGGESPYVRFLRSPFLVATGRYSYALYLIHVPLGLQLASVTGRWVRAADSPAVYDARFVAQAGVATAASWLLAMASWHLFEKHVLKLKRYF
jgi:peptidoglycan/LPS O-acetylase OafA/YrhL